ncbi:MAG: hypothetical protein H0U16_11995 [Actinobacteria bacterium]|nr:hypothetical protein [Actinomycetota bacterium]
MFAALAFFDFLNSREDAILIWIVVAATFLFSRVPDLWPQVLLVTRSFLSPKLLFGIWIPAAVYVLALLFVAERGGAWHTSSSKETGYWFAGTALVLAGGATQANDAAKFWKLVRSVLKVTIVVEFLVNLYVFPLAFELVLIPLIVVFAGMQAVAEVDPKLESVRKLIGFILSILGFVLAARAAASALQDLDGLFTWEHLEQFLVPFALTAVFVPFLFYVALRSTYELVLMRINIFVEDKRLRRRAKWAIVGACRLRLDRIGRFNGRFFSMLHEVRDESDVRELLHAFEIELRTPTDAAFGSS